MTTWALDWFLPPPEHHITPQLGARAMRSLRAIYRRNYLSLGAVKGRRFSGHDGSWDVPGLLPLGKAQLLFVLDGYPRPKNEPCHLPSLGSLPSSACPLLSSPLLGPSYRPPPSHVHKGGSNAGLVSYRCARSSDRESDLPYVPSRAPVHERMQYARAGGPRTTIVRTHVRCLFFSLVLPMGGQGVRVGV